MLNAPGTTTQWADKVKDGPVEIFGDAGPQSQYFDVSAFRSVTEVRFGNSGHGVIRGPSAPNVDYEPLPCLPHGRRQNAADSY